MNLKTYIGDNPVPAILLGVLLAIPILIVVVDTVDSEDGSYVSAAPADGTSCVGATDGEVNAWTESKSRDIPEDVSVSDVAYEVGYICAVGGNAGLPQAFNYELLDIAIELARG